MILSTNRQSISPVYIPLYFLFISMADIFLRNQVLSWEQKWDLVSLVYSWNTWKNCFSPKTTTPHQYYVNDVQTIYAASHSQRAVQCFNHFVTYFYPSIRYTYTLSHNTVTFLDLQLTIDNNHIKSCVNFEATDLHKYLLLSSNHPPSSNIPFPCHNLHESNGVVQTMLIPLSQPSQVKRCCSDNADSLVTTFTSQTMMFRQC